MVVVPSRSIERWHEPPAETQAYEERLLSLLLTLRDPGLMLVYVTSSPVAPAIVEYYLSLLPPAVRADARTRLTLLSADDPSARPLSEKLLARPSLLARIRWAVPAGALGYVMPYMTTELERDLALALDMPLYGADPCHQELGTKSGSRKLFALAGVPHPLGVAHVTGARAAIEAIVRLRAARPGLVEVMVKLDDGVSGEGNAVVDLRGLPSPGGDGERQRVAERLQGMALDARGVSVDAYLTSLAARGGVVEERLIGPDVRSPSVQLDVTPDGDVEIVSTHDQILDGQRYLGCRFPAAPPYAEPIARLAREVGRQLAGAGVIGRSAVDFVVLRDAGGRWRPYAVEVNLRSGGTTHPLTALALLTGGAYDARAATLHDARGRDEALRGHGPPRATRRCGSSAATACSPWSRAAAWGSTEPGSAAWCSTCSARWTSSASSASPPSATRRWRRSPATTGRRPPCSRRPSRRTGGRGGRAPRTSRPWREGPGRRSRRPARRPPAGGSPCGGP